MINVGLKRAATLSLLMAVALLAVNLPLSLGQLCCTPCSVVNLNLTFPTHVQAGQPFTVASTLTVWCYLFPIKIRVDLVDARSYEILCTASLLPSYSPSGSYLVSMADNATAPNVLGGWALIIQAYVIDQVSGFSVGRSSQLFQVVVLP